MLHMECKGSPREMGRPYGEAAREGMARKYAWRKVRERAAEAPGFTAAARALLVERLPEVWEELEGVAEGSGMPWDAVLYDTFTDNPGVPGTPNGDGFVPPGPPSEAGIVLVAALRTV